MTLERPLTPWYLAVRLLLCTPISFTPTVAGVTSFGKATIEGSFERRHISAVAIGPPHLNLALTHAFGTFLDTQQFGSESHCAVPRCRGYCRGWWGSFYAGLAKTRHAALRQP